MNSAVARAFENLKKPWAITGNLAAYMHTKYTGMTPKHNARYHDVIVRDVHNFSNALKRLGYDMKPLKSSRKLVYFKKSGQTPIRLQVVHGNVPATVQYRTGKRVHNLRDLVKTRGNLSGVAQVRRGLHQNLRGILAVSPD
jgi:hypothetical protein